MEEFLNTMYSYEYFGFYLITAIIVLVVLFLIILFFGKKDQKHREIEATKKLEQINTDAFKEENVLEKLEVNNEVNNINQENNLEDTVVVSNFDDMPTLNYIEETDNIPEPILPIVENINEEKLEQKIEEELEEKTDIFEPILEKIEEKPLVLENTNVLNNEIIKELKEDKIVKEEPKIEETPVPEFNLESIMQEVKKEEKIVNSEPIFSSVYVPKKEEEQKSDEIPVEKAMEDLEFELPSLKKEEAEEIKPEEIDVPVLKDYNLDELSGETYNINS